MKFLRGLHAVAKSGTRASQLSCADNLGRYTDHPPKLHYNGKSHKIAKLKCSRTHVYAPCTTITGTEAVRMTLSVTLPMSNRSKAFLPCVPTTMRAIAWLLV